MQFALRPSTIATLGLLLSFSASSEIQNTKPSLIAPDSRDVKALTKKVADWQIEHHEQQGKYRALPTAPPEWMHRERYHDLEWQHGALYAGMNQWRKVADDPKYTRWLRAIGERNEWKLHERPYHADDQVVGQLYLSLYEDFHEPEMLNPVREQFDWILANPRQGTLDWEAESTHAHDRWGWCDALFMAPPVWARLAKVTGNEKYLEFMHREYLATFELLWSEKDHLFWRDSSYFTRSEENGEDIFWARGNGWVFGGLALMIPDLPETWEHRDFYIDLFKKMARRLQDIQRDDGTWSMGLLGGTDGYPVKETSGTAFFTFGLAWGIKYGLLDSASYEPALLRAWKALSESVNEEGMLGFVQPVGAAPGDSFADYTEVYGVGAFLAAGSELYKLLRARETRNAGAAAQVETFMHNSGWCWFQDPRAIIHDGKLIIGGVAGNGPGEAAVGIYDLDGGFIEGRSVLRESFDHDDHNSPVFHPRPDNSLLTVYARHNTEKHHYYRISKPDDYLDWGKEQRIEHDDPVTYMNLFFLEDDARLYNFFRGIQWNPSFVASQDHGLTWGEAQHLIANEVEGYQRPYARYSGNGNDTVGISFTDAHPRDFGNNIYYAEFRAGSFFTAAGRFIKNLQKHGPLLPSEAEEVFAGGGGDFRGVDRSAERSAWTSSIEFDSDSHPHIAYSLYLSNRDQRYRVASWDGSRWIDREVAYAGTRLYEREASYTGLIALDPSDPSNAVISTDVNPLSGEALGGKHQIFRARIPASESRESIHWQRLSYDDKRHNIRPIIATGNDHKVIIWLRGQYRTYTGYNLDAVGLVLPNET